MFKEIQEAKIIPQLGCGGKTIFHALIESALKVNDSEDIVDIGSFFGSTTAFLAIALIARGNKKSTIHAYDKWDIDATYQRKMNRRIGDYNLGDMKPYFDEYIKKYADKVKAYKTDIMDVTEYTGQEIGLLVDDICNGKEMNDQMFRVFSPRFIPGKTKLILMDYWHHTVKPKLPEVYEYQKRFMEHNKTSFRDEGRTERGLANVFTYIGNQIDYGVI